MHHNSEGLELRVLTSPPCLTKRDKPLPINEQAESLFPGYCAGYKRAGLTLPVYTLALLNGTESRPGKDYFTLSMHRRPHLGGCTTSFSAATAHTKPGATTSVGLCS